VHIVRIAKDRNFPIFNIRRLLLGISFYASLIIKRKINRLIKENNNFLNIWIKMYTKYCIEITGTGTFRKDEKSSRRLAPQGFSLLCNEEDKNGRLLDKIITMLRGNGHKRKRDT